MKLDADAISALPAHTAPYPSNSVPGMEGDEKRRLGSEDGKVWPMVMSVGYNPYFKNEKLTAVCHKIWGDMADEIRKFILSIHFKMISTHTICRFLFSGTSGPNLITSQRVSPVTYCSSLADGTEALICDINVDVKVALNSLARPEWAKFSNHPFLEARRGGSAGFSA